MSVWQLLTSFSGDFIAPTACHVLLPTPFSGKDSRQLHVSVTVPDVSVSAPFLHIVNPLINVEVVGVGIGWKLRKLL